MFREQVEKFLRDPFHKNKMENVRYIMKNKDTRIIALIMFYKSKGKNPIKVYIVLSCVLYYLIDNYVCIDYLSCQIKKLKFF